jgi:hypothetical protein
MTPVGFLIKYGPKFADEERLAYVRTRAVEADFNDFMADLELPMSGSCLHEFDDGRCMLCGLDLEYTPLP